MSKQDQPEAPAPRQVCVESFNGETPDGRSLAFVAGESILDPADPGEAVLLGLWAKFFAPMEEAA